MKVEIWSDVVCPWCYIGKRRFETAVAASGLQDEIEVIWRSFQLNPNHPKGLRRAHGEYLAEKLGRSPAEVEAMNAQVTALAAREGLDYHFETYTVVNTVDAHRVEHLAATQGLGDAMVERFMRAQLVEGEVLDDPATLIRLATEVGVPAADVEQVLASNAYVDAVEADIQIGVALGLQGVPFFVIDRAIGISGAQPAEVFERALTMAREREGADVSA
jgi:predicted DsbA family dithiol-disulfide isomerase